MFARVMEWLTRRRRLAALEREVVLERTTVERGVAVLASELRRYQGQERRAAERRRGSDRRSSA